MRALRSILVAGGAGFVGSSLVRHLLLREGLERLVVLDDLSTPGGRSRLAGPDQDPRLQIVEGSINDRPLVEELLGGEAVSGAFNLTSAREDAQAAATAVEGTTTLLAACRAAGVTLLHCSTTAVYGSVPPPARFLETDPLAPSSRRAALQASADLLCQAAFASDRQDVIVTRSSHNYGPRQPADKLIPTIIRHALRDEPITLDGGGMSLRDWIHIDDHCRGLLAAFLRGRPGQVYNLGGNCERTTIGVARTILQILDKPESLLRSGPERSGHDLRRAVDNTKSLGFLGWGPQVKMLDSLPTVVRAVAADLR